MAGKKRTATEADEAVTSPNTRASKAAKTDPKDKKSTAKVVPKGKAAKKARTRTTLTQRARQFNLCGSLFLRHRRARWLLPSLKSQRCHCIFISRILLLPSKNLLVPQKLRPVPALMQAMSRLSPFNRQTSVPVRPFI